MTLISQAAVDLIVAAEVSSRATFEKRYQRPEWPGGMSGITIAIGYDVGYATAAKLRADWTGRIPKEMIDALVPCCGIHASAAAAILPHVKPLVSVPWATAMEVFEKVDEPAWIARVCAAIPGADKLSPDCLGALVSLAYNRGASFNQSGDRYIEMRNIRSLIVAGKLADVPAQFRSMKRLWPTMRGLVDRREAEARLFEKGLKPQGTLPERKPNDTPPPMLPPPKPGSAEAGSGGAVIVATGPVAKKAAENGASVTQIAIIVAACAIAAVGAWFAVRWFKTRTVIARQKDIPT